MIRLGKGEKQAIFTYCVYVLSRETFCFPGDSDWRQQMVYRFGGRSLEKAQGGGEEKASELAQGQQASEPARRAEQQMDEGLVVLRLLHMPFEPFPMVGG